MTATIALVREIGMQRRFTEDDVRAHSDEMVQMAIAYLLDYAERPRAEQTSDFLMDMIAQAETRGLSPRQVAGTLNWLRGEWLQEQRRAREEAERLRRVEERQAAQTAARQRLQNNVLQAETSGEVFELSGVLGGTTTPEGATTPTGGAPDGTYTVIFPEDMDGAEEAYTTIRLKTHDPRRSSMQLPEGSQIAQVLLGPLNTLDFGGFAVVLGNRIDRTWRQARCFSNGHTVPFQQKWARALEVILRTDADGRREMGEAYALRSVRCYRCGLALTTPESIRTGIGPVCRNA